METTDVERRLAQALTHLGNALLIVGITLGVGIVVALLTGDGLWLAVAGALGLIVAGVTLRDADGRLQ